MEKDNYFYSPILTLILDWILQYLFTSHSLGSPRGDRTVETKHKGRFAVLQGVCQPLQPLNVPGSVPGNVGAVDTFRGHVRTSALSRRSWAIVSGNISTQIKHRFSI